MVAEISMRADRTNCDFNFIPEDSTPSMSSRNSNLILDKSMAVTVFVTDVVNGLRQSRIFV